ncbi:MAG: hypothetical protein AAGD01_14065 [Acidobacteriota bacterium]
MGSATSFQFLIRLQQGRQIARTMQDASDLDGLALWVVQNEIAMDGPPSEVVASDFSSKKSNGGSEGQSVECRKDVVQQALDDLYAATLLTDELDDVV